MLICPKCNATYVNNSNMSCINCGFHPKKRNKIIEWINKNEKINYPIDGFITLQNNESKYFWFRSRSELIVMVIKKYFKNVKKIYDMGCGTGYILSVLEKEFKEAELYGSDIFIEALMLAQKKLSENTNLMVIDAYMMPFFNEFDLILSCDVLEHLSRDEDVLKKLYKAAKPGGGLIITVPQHMWLWSKSDDDAGHVRRYSKDELQNKITRSGWNILDCTSFISLLLPAIMVSRLINKSNNRQEKEFLISPWLNNIFYQITSFERKLIKAGIKFPFGSSLIFIAKKDGV